MSSDSTHVWLPLDEAWTEVIFAAFHDPAVSATLPVEIEASHATGVTFNREWCWSTIRWESAVPGQVAAALQLACGFELHHYDTLLICLTMPNGCQLHVAETVATGNGQRMEVAVPLRPGRLESVRLEFAAATNGPHMIWLSWLALRDSTRTKLRRPKYEPTWPGLIKPRDEWGATPFTRGLLFDFEQLDAPREKLHNPGWRRHVELLQSEVDRCRRRAPEDDLGLYLPLGDHRYMRVADAGRAPYHWEALLVGFMGLLRDDRELIHLALRYLMYMLHTPHWAQSAESRLPGSTWDQRCFVEEMTTTSVCLLTDWFGSLLTPRALDLARQSVWDKGLAFIERDMMKWAYVHECAQGALFCRARILGGLLLERAWPKMGDYVERAYRDLEASLQRSILPDGGVGEGPGYLCQTAHAAIPALIAYARAHGQLPVKLLHQHLGRCEAYVRVMSGMQPGTMQPEGDCRLTHFYGDTIPIMAAVMPDSAFRDILQPCLDTGSVYRLTGLPTNSGGWLSLVYGPPSVAAPRSIVPTFAILPNTGQLASLRSRTLIHLTGCPARPHHSHLDKGAFTLEVDGLAVVIDRGMVRYDDWRAEFLYRTAMHNTLTPCRADGTFPDQSYPEQSVIPTGRGDETHLSAEIDLAHVWREDMIRYRRRIRAETHAEFIVEDEGELKNEARVAFHLHALQPFQIKGQSIRLGKLEIAADWAESATQCEDLVNHEFVPVYHLVLLSRSVKAYSLRTAFRHR